MDVEKTIENIQAAQAKMQTNHELFRAEFWSNMAAFHERQAAFEKRQAAEQARSAEEHARWKARMAAAEARMDRDQAEWRERADRADARMDKFDKQLQATRRLVEAGMKIVLQIGQRQKKNEELLKQLMRGQQGTNGRGGANRRSS
jgi:hypothetical protein